MDHIWLKKRILAATFTVFQFEDPFSLLPIWTQEEFQENEKTDNDNSPSLGPIPAVLDPRDLLP